MKRSLIIILLLCPFLLFAQEKTWRDHLNSFSIQTGSGVGMYTFGIGNHTWVNNIDVDLLFGFVPERINNDELWYIMSAKGTWDAWNFSKDQFHFHPIRLGLNINYTLDDNFNLNNATDSRYPSNYYWWSPAVRFNPFIGSSVDFQIKNNRLSLYHELGTNDLYISSYFSNDNYEELSVGDVLVWGFGLKWYLGPVSEPTAP